MSDSEADFLFSNNGMQNFLKDIKPVYEDGPATKEEYPDFDRILTLPPELIQIRDQILSTAFIGNKQEVLERFNATRDNASDKRNITDLEEEPAFITPKDEVFVCNDIYSDKFAEAILEHEVYETTFRKLPQDKVMDILRQMRLLETWKRSIEQEAHPTHYIGIYFELKKAAELGILDDYLKFKSDRVEAKLKAIPNPGKLVLQEIKDQKETRDFMAEAIKLYSSD